MRIFCVKHRLTGAAIAALAAFGLMTGTAEAADCSDLDQTTFGSTLPQGFFNFSISPEQFTLQPGQTVTIRITLPPATSASVLLPSGLEDFDNSQNNQEQTFTRTITVQDTGGASIGSVSVSGTTSLTGQSILVEFDCAEAGGGGNTGGGNNNGGGNTGGGAPGDLNGAQAGSQVDSVVQTVIPGSVNGGGLEEEFGVAFFSPLIAIGFNDPGLNELTDCEETARERRSLISLKKDIIAKRPERIADRKAALESARANLADIDADLAELEKRRELARLTIQSVDREVDASTLPDGSLADESLAQSFSDAFDALGDLADQESILQRDRAEAQKEIDGKQFFLDKEQQEAEADAGELAELEAELAEIEARCASLRGASLAPSGTPPVMTGLAQARRLQSPGTPNRSLTPPLPFAIQFSQDGRRMKGRFDLESLRTRMNANGGSMPGLLGNKRFNMWLNAGAILHKDSRSGLGQDGTTRTIAGGFSYLLTPRLNAGLAARYGHTERDSARADTEVKAISLAAFAQAKLARALILNTTLSYTDASVDTALIQTTTTARAETDATSIAGQVSLSRPTLAGGWTLVPQVGASAVTYDRDGFTASDGTVAPSSKSTQVSVQAGISASRDFAIKRSDGSSILLSPSIGVTGFANAGRFDDLVGSTGTQVDSQTAGMNASAGLTAQFPDGSTFGINAGASGLTGEQKNISLSVRFSMPF